MQIWHSFLYRKSVLYFFLIIEAKLLHSLDTGSKCENKKLTLKQWVILMKHCMTLSLNINTSELLGLYRTPTLKLSAKFCRSRAACLAKVLHKTHTQQSVLHKPIAKK